MAGVIHQGSVSILPARLLGWGGYEDVDPILQSADQVDILVLGTGAELKPLPDEFQSCLETVGIGVEWMATPAACRTYNLLLAEGRRVAAVLFPI